MRGQPRLNVPRRKRHGTCEAWCGVEEAPQEGTEEGQGLLRQQEPFVPGRQRAGHAVGQLCLPRPSRPQGRDASSVDPAHQRRHPSARHELQPVHRRAERRRHRGRPQDPRPISPSPIPPRSASSSRQPRARWSERPHSPECAGVQQQQGSRTAAPPGAPQFASRRASLRGRRPRARRRGGRGRLGRARRSSSPRAPTAPSTAPAPVFELADGVLERVAIDRDAAGTAGHRRDARRRARTTCCRTASFVVVLDRVGDPGNLGTILRSAEAAGADLVVLTPGQRRPVQSEGGPLIGGSAVPRPRRHRDDRGGRRGGFRTVRYHEPRLSRSDGRCRTPMPT